MKTPIIVFLIALACYSLANLINGRIESVEIAPMTAAIFAGVGAFAALSVTNGIK